MEKWYDNCKSTDEENYIDWLDLKKNDVIKDFVVKTLIEKVGTTRTVQRILEVMIEKYARTLGEKTQELMRKISGDCFKKEERIDKVIDKFEETITEVDKRREENTATHTRK